MNYRDTVLKQTQEHLESVMAEITALRANVGQLENAIRETGKRISALEVEYESTLKVLNSLGGNLPIRKVVEAHTSGLQKVDDQIGLKPEVYSNNYGTWTIHPEVLRVLSKGLGNEFTTTQVVDLMWASGEARTTAAVRAGGYLAYLIAKGKIRRTSRGRYQRVTPIPPREGREKLSVEDGPPFPAGKVEPRGYGQ